MNKTWLFALAIAFAFGLGLNHFLSSQSATSSSMNSSEVTLFGEENKPVALFDPQDPRIRVVYFGFTRCPDVCPTSLAMLAGALNQIDEQTQQQFRPIFISLDPERDAAADAHQYAQYFHPMLEGLSAPLEVTTPLAHQYGVIFRKTQLENSQLEYTLDHSSYFYFLKPDGTLITKVPHTLTPAPLVDAFNTLTSKG
ncbi:SCO family protein [Vibrio sinaloensis]|uniref:SCO family protein n=1 Tax=Photobacterium sp. (strain ATCC 43367) TaxID=379097 RepID=UPI002056C6C7|nr:SCO family protein [Vibrio sinaloensis]UPQ90235.1 SCO family protein [Vibrio sinaloensis]